MKTKCFNTWCLTEKGPFTNFWFMPQPAMACEACVKEMYEDLKSMFVVSEEAKITKCARCKDGESRYPYDLYLSHCTCDNHKSKVPFHYRPVREGSDSMIDKMTVRYFDGRAFFADAISGKPICPVW